MDKVRVRRIAPGERRRLKRMKRQRANGVNQTHARIILLSSGGVGNRKIGELVDRTARWVREIIHRFNRSGLPGIEWYPWMQGCQGSRKFFSEVVEQIAEVALSSPQMLIGMSQWSLSKLREYLVGQKIIDHISLDWLRTLLLRCGVRWRHTKTWKESTDPEFWSKYRRIRRLYATRPSGGRRICVDEFGPLNLQPRHGQCCAKAGCKRVDRIRATYHRHGGVRHFLAAFDLETGRLFGQFQPTKTWRDFLAFLKWLRRRYRTNQVLHVVLDNFRPHLKSEVLQWAQSHRVKLYFTPTNASWLNRIECQFAALRKFALNNTDFLSHEEQQAAIESYLDWRNGWRDIAIEPWRTYKQRLKPAAQSTHHLAA